MTTTKCHLSIKNLKYHCDENMLDFDTTETVAPLEVMIGQERAVKAVEFGLYTKNLEYNIFISGLVGTGKITYAKAAVGRVAEKEDVPDDWCYVNNFENPGVPIAFSLPPGLGYEFQQDMQELVEDLKNDIPKMFSSDEYEHGKEDVLKKFQNQRDAIVEKFNKEAEEMEVMPQWTSSGFVGVPLLEGKPVTPEDFQKLDKEQRDIFEKKMVIIHNKAMEVVHQAQQLEREVREEMKQLDSRIGLFVAGHLIDELKEKYRPYEQVISFLNAVQKDVVKNINDYKPSAGEEEQNPFQMFRKNTENSRDKYKVNLFLDHRKTKGAPVIVENNPTYYNLLGRVEYETRMGMVSTDYTMIKPGAFHKANGGYLILNARDVLSSVGAWEALKRVLKIGRLHIENLGEQYGALALASLKPQPIPINVKIILIGNPMLYHLLYAYDEDFRKLFKVHADFDVEMVNNPVNIKKLAGFISSTIKREKLRHFDRCAVARIVEHACRLSGSQKKLTTRFNEVVDILCEADIWAKMDDSPVVTGAHIRKAIEEKRYRANKYEDKLLEMFAEGKILIDTEGEKVGQVNGLAVLGVGEYMFGKPSRITANNYLGRSGVVNIERETKMSGTSHTKGVLILSGYMGEKYAQKQPLTLAASLTFEQLYEGVDGDSASSTELYALLSSLSGVPIRQNIAVTGSVNQKGEIQPIGGVTQKIEGFFDVCKLKGFTGTQGVMIPCQNIDNLTLKDEVIDAFKAGKFHIYGVKTVDEGIEVLTGVSAGVADEEGNYPEGTIHYLVAKRLRENTEALLRLNKEGGSGNGEAKDGK